ncbi:MAG: DUF1365 domain-containing protein [Planctomycetota bacterium]
MHSCLYHGTVRHRRTTPVSHAFGYSMSWLYLDLDEVPGLLRKQRWLSSNRFSVASFLPADHLPDNPDATLDDLRGSIRSKVDLALGRSTQGPIRLLTPLRHFGIYFSPLCVYYVWDSNDSHVQAVVAEVSNTPWREKHWYVLSEKTRQPGSESESRHRCDKQFHVSPFMDINHQYEWVVDSPDGSLNISIQNRQHGTTVHSAAMQLERRPLTDSNLFRMILRYPLLPMQSLAAIYYQALLLWMKKVPYIPHPKTKKVTEREIAAQGVAGS